MLPSIKNYLLIVLFLFALSAIYGQSNSYILIDDPSGWGPNSSELANLEEAADNLVAAFPELYRDSFKVIEGAIYPVMGYTAEGVEESWEKLKTQAAEKSTYQLLMVRAYDHDGKVSVRWNLVLPSGQPFDCIDNVKKQLFFGEMTYNINREVFRYGNVVTSLNLLQEKFDNFLYEGFRSGCAYCPGNTLGLGINLLQLGFVGKKIRDINVNGSGGVEGSYKYNKKVTIFPYDHDSINIYNDQKDFHEDLSSVMEDLYTNFVYYNTSTTEGCNDITDYFEEEMPLAVGNKGLEVRSSATPYIYRNDVIVIDGGEGERWVYVKESSNLDNIPDFPKGRIQIVLLPGTGLNLNELISKVDTFYNLIDVDPTVMSYEFAGTPNKLGVANLKAKDAVSIVGKKGLTVATFVKETYKSLLSTDFFDDDITSDGFVVNPNNIERGDVWGHRKISIVKTESMDTKTLNMFKCAGDKNKLASFLIFHATGHNAGIGHGATRGYPAGYGYMDDGNSIVWMLGKNHHGWGKFEPELNSLVDLINYTKIHFENMIELIKLRYE